MIDLREVPLLADLSDSELQSIRDLSDEREFAKGDIVLRQGEPATALYVILKGTARVTAIMAEEQDDLGRDEEVLLRLKAGDFFGEMSFVDGTVPSLSIISEEDGSRYMVIPHDGLRKLLDSDGALCRRFLMAMMRTLATRLRDTDRELVLSRYFIRGS